VEVCTRFVVPVVQPAAIQLIQDFLFGDSKIWIVVLCSNLCKLSLETESYGPYAQTLLFGIRRKSYCFATEL
jgi:hypothetical protein